MLETHDISVELRLARTEESLSDLQRVVAALDSLHASSLLAVAASPKVEDPDVVRLRRALAESKSRGKAGERFFPYFRRGFSDSGEDGELGSLLEFYRQMDPEDPLDVGVAEGLKRWVAEVAKRVEGGVASNRFPVVKIERQSPLLISLSIGLAAPMILTFGLLYAAGRFRRQSAEGEIREQQARAMASLARQQEQRERFQKDVYDALRARLVSDSEGRSIPDSVIANATQIANLEIGELSDKSLVGSINLGLNLKS